MKLKIGGLSGKDAQPSPNDEFAFVRQGEVVLTWEQEEQLLVSGDSVVIPAGVSRRWRNDTQTSGTDTHRVGKGPFLGVLSLASRTRETRQ